MDWSSAKQLDEVVLSCTLSRLQGQTCREYIDVCGSTSVVLDICSLFRLQIALLVIFFAETDIFGECRSPWRTLYNFELSTAAFIRF